MTMQSKSALLKARVAGAALATVLLLASPLAAAKTDAESGDHWSKWQSLGGGYVGRRKVPPKANLPKSERRLDTTQARGKSKLKTTRMRGKSKKVKLESTSTALSTTTLAATAEIVNIDALWLRTLGAGLYGAPIADLAAQLGERTGRLRRKATKGKLSLTNDDQPVSWHFDSATDMILFAAVTYDTFYTDQNAYRFWLGRDKAQPMEVADGPPTSAIGNETPFRETLKFEEEPDFFFGTWSVGTEQDADYWWWDYLHGGYRDVIDIELNIPNPASTGTAQLRVTLRGWTDLEPGDEHHVFAELNGQQVGSEVTWDGFEEMVLVADFDQSLLNTSGNNTLRLRNRFVTGTHPGQWLDQVEVDYSRLPVVAGGMLWMHDLSVGTQTVTGLTSDDIIVVESPGENAVMREDVRLTSVGSDGWSVTFETANEVDYLIAERNIVNVPVLAADYPSSLDNRDNSAAYLIVAPRELSGTANALAAYREGRFGLVKIAWLDDIFDEFNAGRKDPEAISRFMQHVINIWQVSPTNVTLIGKGSLDEKDRMDYGDSFLPIRMSSTPWGLSQSDDRLLAGEGEVSFAIGRLPLTNDAEGVAYVDKLIAYESVRPGAERFDAVLVADDPDEAGDFHTNSDLLADRLLDTLGFNHVTKLQHPHDLVRDTLVKSVTWETGFVSYDGHGSAGELGNGLEEFMKTEDAAFLNNSNYPVFSALTCSAGEDTIPGRRSIATALVLNPTGGAIAAMAPTGLSLDAEAQLLGNAFVDSLFGGSNTIGDAVIEAKSQNSDSISEFMLHIYSVVGEPAVYAR